MDTKTAFTSPMRTAISMHSKAPIKKMRRGDFGQNIKMGKKQLHLNTSTTSRMANRKHTMKMETSSMYATTRMEN